MYPFYTKGPTVHILRIKVKFYVFYMFVRIIYCPLVDPFYTKKKSTEKRKKKDILYCNFNQSCQRKGLTTNLTEMGYTMLNKKPQITRF